jgi:hypothetical protein
VRVSHNCTSSAQWLITRLQRNTCTERTCLPVESDKNIAGPTERNFQSQSDGLVFPLLLWLFEQPARAVQQLAIAWSAAGNYLASYCLTLALAAFMRAASRPRTVFSFPGGM